MGSGYSAGALPATHHYYVVVNSNGVVATSAVATVNVYPQLVSGTISQVSQEIAYNSAPSALSVSSGTGGNGTYAYQWYSDAGGAYQAVASGSSYTPGPLTATTHFYVVTTSNGATVTSPVVTVVVAPPLTAGTITPSSLSISSGMNPGTLTCTPASGGGCGGNVWFGCPASGPTLARCVLTS